MRAQTGSSTCSRRRRSIRATTSSAAGRPSRATSSRPRSSAPRPGTSRSATTPTISRACSRRSGRARSSSTSVTRTTRPAPPTAKRSCSPSSTGSRTTSSASSTRRTSSTSTTRTTSTGSTSSARVAGSRCCARSRRSTGSPACGSVGRWRRRTSPLRRARCGARSTWRRPRRRQRSRASTTPQEIARRRELNATGRDRLAEILRGHGLDPVGPARGNFLFADVGGGRELFERLQREGVIVRPLDGFGAPEAIRVTVGTPEENEFFAVGLGHVLSGVS